jgi:uncharacterized protein YggU (UPF0235/DUF167 family)
MYIQVKAFPSSPREVIETVGEHRYRIFIRQPAEQGMANTRIKQILGGLYDKNPDAFQLVAGSTGMSKVFKVLGTYIGRPLRGRPMYVLIFIFLEIFI